MCLLAYDNDSQSRSTARRRLAGLGILPIAVSLIGLLYPRTSDLSDFLRGLMIGIGLALSIAAFTMCARRPRNSH